MTFTTCEITNQLCGGRMLNIKNTTERGKKLKNTTIVTYHNFMNQIIFKGFQKRDYDFFMVLCSQLRDQKTNKIILTFREIKGLYKNS